MSHKQRQFKIQKERLTNDLVKILNKFQDVQKLSMQKQRESNDRAKANMSLVVLYRFVFSFVVPSLHPELLFVYFEL